MVVFKTHLFRFLFAFACVFSPSLPSGIKAFFSGIFSFLIEVHYLGVLLVEVFWVTFRISSMSLKMFPFIRNNLTNFLSFMNMSRYSPDPSMVLTKMNDKDNKESDV